ncbi:hypothetical protein CANARDRAFT_27379, partial [[Candida] arabinofermentans NRRL YB-2248]
MAPMLGGSSVIFDYESTKCDTNNSSLTLKIQLLQSSNEDTFLLCFIQGCHM